MEAPHSANPVISIQNPSGGSRLARSPSRDSVTTEFSLGSCMESVTGQPSSSPKPSQDPRHHHPSSSANLRVTFRSRSECHMGRGPSPIPCDRLAVPLPTTRPCSANSSKGVKDIWLDDENDLIRSCGALSRALGLQKSFSTSDILTGPDWVPVRNTRSDMFLLECGQGMTWGRLEANSRSLSTWVAVGDVQSSTSQLPSPQVELNKAFPEGEYTTSQFTAADFIRSVNKKVRQNYIRRRLKVTYKALEQFSESEFDLDRLEETVNKVKKSRQSQNLDEVVVVSTANNSRNHSSVVGQSLPPGSPCPGVSQVLESAAQDFCIASLSDSVKRGLGGGTGPVVVSQKEIERDRGKPLTKYERNIMIFDWLHALDETATVPPGEQPAEIQVPTQTNSSK